MAKIRSLKLQDIPKLKKMISMLSVSDTENILFGFKSFVPFPISSVHACLPLRCRCLNESFVSIDDGQINGMISLSPRRGNPYNRTISELFLNKNSYATGSQLIGYATAKFGAMGANTFTVKVDSNSDELMELFSKACGFRMCSSEQLWQPKEVKLVKPGLDKGFFRPFKNSDAQAVQSIHNDCIFPHFRYSLAKTKHEFINSVFCGLENTSYFKYVLEENGSVKGYICIETTDDKNFILDIDLVQGYDDCYCDVINFAIGQILVRRKNFNLYILNKKYQVSGSKFEDYLKKNNFKCVKSQVVMVKDYYKKIREEERSQKPGIVFSEIRKPAFKASLTKPVKEDCTA